MQQPCQWEHLSDEPDGRRLWRCARCRVTVATRNGSAAALLARRPACRAVDRVAQGRRDDRRAREVAPALRAELDRWYARGFATRRQAEMELLLDCCRSCDHFTGRRCRRLRCGCAGTHLYLATLTNRRRWCERWGSRKRNKAAGRIFVIGYPGDVGGANTECWHTIKLWRRFGLDVTLVPTWQADSRWRKRLDHLGCRTVPTKPDRLHEVEGLAGATIVSFCNSLFLEKADRFRELGCKIVWVNCMTWLFAAERRHYERHGPFDRFVFQSRHQQELLVPQLRRYGYRDEQGHLIRGALDFDEFPFRPRSHPAGEPFVIGRISRAALDKYSSNTWPIYRRIPHPIRARVMAWDRKVERKVGSPPDWAQCLAAGQETPQQFLGKLHCMLQVNGGAGENWPRSGLEAMAAGVPVVVQNQWGWREMIRHGQTGYLAGTDDELAYHAARLAYDEDHRMDVVHRARQALEEELANPETIWKGWKRLLESTL